MPATDDLAVDYQASANSRTHDNTKTTSASGIFSFTMPIWLPQWQNNWHRCESYFVAQKFFKIGFHVATIQGSGITVFYGLDWIQGTGCSNANVSGREIVFLSSNRIYQYGNIVKGCDRNPGGLRWLPFSHQYIERFGVEQCGFNLVPPKSTPSK